MLITGAEIEGIPGLDVRLTAGRISEIAPELCRDAGEPLLDAAGGVLLPGLQDHHIHLFAQAAADTSVRCGPPEVRDARALGRALVGSSGSREWIRGIGYHESVAGDLSRKLLDELIPDRPVRVQHRSGAMWVLNSPGVDRLGLDHGVDQRGVERDARGQATGRLLRLDDWLRERLDSAEPPTLAPLSRRLAGFGVTGLTDATVSNTITELRAFIACADRGELLQDLTVMGTLGLPSPGHRSVARGAVKVLLEERDLPDFDAFKQTIEAAHHQGRPVAVHCITRPELVLAAAAIAAAGSQSGDRIEHAAVAPPDAVRLLAELHLTVVTQPGFVRERGDIYLVDVEPREQPWLYRCRGFLDGTVPLGGGTDAPFGDPDPWRAMQSAVDRRTEAGATLEPDEGLTPEQALSLFTSPATAPGAAPRRVEVGAPADLCLLDRPWSRARTELCSDLVAATIRDGAIIWQAGC